MTKLIIKPLDFDAPGSWRERHKFREIAMRLDVASRSDNPVEQFAAMQEAEDWVVSHLRTDDGTPIKEALDSISAREFDMLFRAAGTEDIVPPGSASNSSSPSEVTPPTSLGG